MPSEALTFGWERLKADPGTILATIVVGVTAVLLTTWIVQGILFIVGGVGAAASRHAGPALDLFTPLAVMMRLVGGFVGQLAWAFIGSGIAVFCLKVARGQPYAFGDVFTGAPYFVSVLIAQFIVNLVAGVGLIFLIVPGVVLFLGLNMATLLIVDRGLGPMEAISESWRITDGHKMNLFMFWLLCAGMFIIGACLCLIGALFATPIVLIAQAYIYLKITNQPVAVVPRPGY